MHIRPPYPKTFISHRISAILITYEYIQAAKEGFWDKVPLVNVFAANNRIMNMFKKIGTAYNTVLSDAHVEKIKSECSITFENRFFGLISPIDMGCGKKVTSLLEKRKAKGLMSNSIRSISPKKLHD